MEEGGGGGYVRCKDGKKKGWAIVWERDIIGSEGGGRGAGWGVLGWEVPRALS